MTGSARPMRILILGGTAEARALAGRLGRARSTFAVTLVARRPHRRSPRRKPCRCGSAASAAPRASPRYLRDERIDVLIDATHPYAAAISANAAQRRRQRRRVKLLALRRPPWTQDRRRRLDRGRRRRGRGGALWARRRAACSSRSAARSFSPSPPRRSTIISSAASIRSIRRSRCRTRPTSPRAGRSARPRTARCSNATASRLVVAKNSGGDATYGKIAAARALGLPVIMLKRPALPEVAVGRDGRGGAGLARSCADAFRRRAACRPAGSGPAARSPASRAIRR